MTGGGGAGGQEGGAEITEGGEVLVEGPSDGGPDRGDRRVERAQLKPWLSCLSAVSTLTAAATTRLRRGSCRGKWIFTT